jgi:hypothetical protein
MMTQAHILSHRAPAPVPGLCALSGLLLSRL